MNFASYMEPPVKTMKKKKKHPHLEKLHKARGIHFNTVLNNVSREHKVKKKTHHTKKQKKKKPQKTTTLKTQSGISQTTL